MTESTMANRLKVFGELVPEFRTALQSFKGSDSRFRVLKTIHPRHSSPQNATQPSPEDSPRSLVILDSSYNPPSIAHQALAISALTKSDLSSRLPPSRLLLLFSTLNADKAPTPAAFDQRLTMMALFARDLLDEMLASPDLRARAVPVDIGVTTAPYYTDKTAAIESDGQEWYPLRPKQLHLLGYDTLVRFFAAKYYPNFDPPLSALAPYFNGGHGLRATLRPDDQSGGSVDEQAAFVDRLRNGDLESDGAPRDWARQVTLVPPNAKAGVSSTRIRKAVQSGSWDEVRQLCTPSVAAWLMREKESILDPCE